MLDKDEFLHWCQKLGLSEEGRIVIEQVRTSDPARRVQSGSRNVSGTYPSKKMNVTIQFESHRVELAAVYEMEHDPDVIEYYDQPPSFKLEYSGMNGRRLAVFHTPDYFAIRKDTAGWEECKTEEELERLTEKNPPLLPRRRWRVALPSGRGLRRTIQLLLPGPYVKDYKLGLPAQHPVRRGLSAHGSTSGR